MRTEMEDKLEGDIKALAKIFVMIAATFMVGTAAFAGSPASHVVNPNSPLIHNCSSCHGANGVGDARMDIPRIGGMNAGYLIHALKSMANGTWQSAVMSPIARPLTDKQVEIVAHYFAKQSPPPLSSGTTIQSHLVHGWLLATQGDWKNAIPACTLCHGKRGNGIGTYFPRLAEQNAGYLESQIYAWRVGTRHDDPLGLMETIAKRLRRTQIDAVVRYFSEVSAESKMSVVTVDRVPAGFIDRQGRFVPPSKNMSPSGPFGDMVRLGHKIFEHTAKYARRFSGNVLSCDNCHIDAGRLAHAGPMWAAYVAYPAYRKKTKKVNSFAQRLQGCFRYSMNGLAPPLHSKVLLALETYSYFLATGAPTGKILKGRGYPKLNYPAQGMSYGRGRVVFQSHCALCHGTHGQGRHTESGTSGFPPLWGSGSYNWGAGMSNVKVAARFIKANMPLGLGGTLTVQEAWDVAMFVDSHQRPQDPRFNGSVVSTRAKYHNSATSMYGRVVNGEKLGEPVVTH